MSAFHGSVPVTGALTASELRSQRERDAIIYALRSGVVPKQGLRHIQVGRLAEVRQIEVDLDKISCGGAAVRFVIGEYGSGKSFFLEMARLVMTEKNVVVMRADLSPDRRLHATGGQARSFYSELVRNLSTRSKPDGGALGSVVEKFMGEVSKNARLANVDISQAIQERLSGLGDLVSGPDFATVVEIYWRASQNADTSERERGKAAALRWMRGEYALKSQARDELGVRSISIIDDANVYDYLKIMAAFVRLAGYGGLLVVVDECVNLYKLDNAVARKSNYEQILRIINDALQGTAQGIGFYFGGTPEFLMDTRRGLNSYEALRSRLQENSFVRTGLVDFSGPVMRLQQLTPEDIYVLLEKLRDLAAGGNPLCYGVPDAALEAFLEHSSKQIGAAYFRTPRNTIKAFLDLLAIIEQNPGTHWQQILGTVRIEAEQPSNVAIPGMDNPVQPNGDKDLTAEHGELASFKV